MSHPIYPAEQSILLAALRLDDAQDAILRRELAAGPDWATLRDIAISHCVLAVLYVRLKEVLSMQLRVKARA